MMSLWDALRMNMMISYQELVRTFPKEIGGLIASGFGPILAGIFCTMTESWYPIAIMIMAYSVIGLISALKMPEVKDRDLSALEDAAEDQPRVVRAAQPSRSL